jgi:hypothetical protein
MFWFVWLFIFIPVLAWLLGFLLPPAAQTETKLPESQSNPELHQNTSASIP